MSEASFVRLVGDRVVVRRLQQEDAPFLAGYRGLPEVSRYQSWTGFSVEQAGALIEDMDHREPGLGTWYQVAIEAKGELVGDLGYLLDQRERSTARIGYNLAPVHQGRGYATEAVAVFLDWAFNAYGLHRVVASVHPENQRSIDLLERLGFRREAHHVEAIRFKGEWVDDYGYALLGREWEGWTSEREGR